MTHEILTAVTVKITIIWDGTSFLKNSSKHLLEYTLSQKTVIFKSISDYTSN